MKNKDKIIILKAKVIKLKEQLKAARLELADRDNEIDRKNKLLSIARFPAKEIPTYKVVIDEKDGVDNITITDNPQQPFVAVTDTPLTPPTKENIDYDYGG
jgi:hypothetical protein